MSFEDPYAYASKMSFACYKETLNKNRSWYVANTKCRANHTRMRKQRRRRWPWRLNCRNQNNQVGGRYTNKLLRSRHTELQKQVKKKAISKTNRYKKNQSRKFETTLPHHGCFDDNYFCEPHESLCLKAYMRYYNWKNDNCQKIDHSIYDYDYKYFDLCHKQNSYITRHEHYDFYFQVLSMLKPGMLCYYREPACARYGHKELSQLFSHRYTLHAKLIQNDRLNNF